LFKVFLLVINELKKPTRKTRHIDLNMGQWMACHLPGLMGRSPPLQNSLSEKLRSFLVETDTPFDRVDWVNVPRSRLITEANFQIHIRNPWWQRDFECLFLGDEGLNAGITNETQLLVGSQDHVV
jgi:hypothetical protein